MTRSQHLTRLGVMLAMLLPPVLTGCSGPARVASATNGATDLYDGAFSAREYGFVRPSPDAVRLDPGSDAAAAAGGGASFWQRIGLLPARPSGGGDLWSRVRTGMRLDLQANVRIDDALQSVRRQADYLERLSRRAGPWLHLIVTEIERRGLPMELVLLPHIESRFDPEATSPKAAAGIWQFMPATGREMGLRQDQWYDGRRDILASTRAALDYLEQLRRRFDGDWALAMAAYNCGPGCVAAARAANREAGQADDFWSLRLPRETMDYVPRILAAARLVAAPQRYGLRLPPVPDRPQLEVVRTPVPLDLARVATAAGLPVGEIRRLNPGFRQERTLPDGADQLLVPAGTGRRLAAARLAEVVASN